MHSPPVAVEDLLLEEGSVGAEERGRVHASAVGIQQTHVVALTTHVDVSVVAWKTRKKSIDKNL